LVFFIVSFYRRLPINLTVPALVPAQAAERVLAAMRAHPAGHQAAAIGEVEEGSGGLVVLHTVFGGQRIVDMLVGEQLPRIC
jgi:hydrogenase expression/formation protein HypE